ncbi:10491_t:CDS:2 [Funneliformis geosporum]|uniref:17811_t:CDS:1 n=1 Tax=Funneliformis geosporum TaxID=1117311 RepID=A0A9W4WM50_9GLOM|nr:10491_t:CDS:2 [Funneliformis geosporum]CAI2171728.1 17811_t:CDS:2 [Funneliformis geosporum]
MAYTFANVKIEKAGLTVTTSDATSEHHPTNTIADTPDEDGKQFYYRPIKRREQKWVLYCTKLGAALARELKRANSDSEIPTEILTDLPKGYQLFEHVKNYINDPKKYRTDTYLFGLGSIKFRSPAEFEDHLLWLASDQSTQCICKYCSKDSTPRKKIQSTPQRSVQQTTPQSALTKKSLIVSPSNQVESKSKKSTSNNEQLPYDISYYIRSGEVAWFKTSTILPDNHLEELKKGNVDIGHWPGYVIERQKFSQAANDKVTRSQIGKISYRVQPFNVAGVLKALEDQVVPWLMLSSENFVKKIYKIKEDHESQGKYSPTLMRIISLFCSACDIARRISKTYALLDSYTYTFPPLFLQNIKDLEERRLLQEMEKCPHYKSIFFGSEILKEEDYVRMNDVVSKGNNIRVFKINTIYKNSENKLFFNGDIYLKASTKNGKISWSRLNEEDREYFIELKEISGRYYDTHPFIDKSMEVEEVISFNERKNLLEIQETNKTTKRSIASDDPLDTSTKKPKVRNENVSPQKKALQHSHPLDMNSKEVGIVKQKVDPLVISPTIPFLEESDDEISEVDGKLFEMLSNNS